MKKTILILSVLFALLSTRATAQTYTFECVSASAMTGDSCEGCLPWQIQSRSFDGLVIWKSGLFYRWIEIPYTLKVRGDTVDIWEHTSPPSRLGKNQFFPDRISITLAQTPFSTIQGFVDSVWCNRPANGTDTAAIWHPSDSTNVGSIYRGDTLTIVGRGIIGVNFDSLLNKYVITADTTGLGGGGGGSGTVFSIAATAPAAGFTISGSPITTSGTFVFTLADDLAALEALSGTGIVARTASNTYALRTITAGTGSITVTNGDGVLGNPTINNTDPDQSTTNEIQTYGHAGTTNYVNTLSSGGGSFTINASTGIGISHTAGTITITNTGDLSATNELQIFTNSSDATHHYLVLSDGGGSITLTEGSGITLTTSGTGSDGIVTIASSGGSGTLTSIGYVAPAAGITISGTNPVTSTGTWTFALANDLAAVEGLSGTGLAVRTGTSTWTNRTITGSSNISVSNGDGVSGNPTISVTGVPTGTGTNGRLTLWGPSGVTDDAAFTYDGTNNRITITGTVAGTGANNAFLNLNAGSISGATEFLRMSANISGNMIAGMYNANSINTSANSLLTISTGGGGGGDPIIQFNVSGANTTAFGTDNSDADKVKITPGSSTPGGTTNHGLILTQDAVTKVGINRDAPTDELDVDGRVRADQFIGGEGNVWSTSNIAAGAGMGTGGAVGVTSISGANNWFQITFNTGTDMSAATGGVIFTATFPTPFPNITYTVFSSRHDNSSIDIGKVKTAADQANSFQLKAVTGLVLQANRTYAFTFNTGSYR